MSRFGGYLVFLIYGLIVLLPVFCLLVVFLVNGYFGSIGFDLRQIILLKNSLMVAFGSSIVALALGLPLAFFLGRAAIPGKTFFSWAYLIPLLIPPYIQTIVWINLLGEGGFLNSLLSCGGLSPYGIGGCIMVLGFSYFPLITLLVLSGLTSVDRRLEEAARLTHPWKSVLSRITWPLIRPQALGGFLLVFIFAISNYAVPSLLRVNTYPVEIFIQFGAFYDYGAAFAGMIPLIVISLVLLLLHRVIMGQRSYVVIGGRARKTEILKSRRLSIIGLVFSSLLIGIAGIIPVFSLIMRAGSPHTFLAAFRTSGGTILFTFLLAAGSSLIIALLASLMGRVIVRGRGMIKHLTNSGSFLPFAIPPTIFGVALIMTWNRPFTQFIYTSLLILVIAFIARFVAFSIRVMVAQFRQLDPNLAAAASLIPVSRWKRWIHIEFPLILPGFLVAWLVGFVLCMRELGATLLVIPPGRETLTLRIYNLMHYGAGNLVSALSVIVIVISLIPVLIVVYGMRRKARH